jgi:hypothetical protein
MTESETDFCEIAQLFADAVADIRRYRHGERFVPSGPLRVYGVPTCTAPAISLQMRYAYMWLRQLHWMWGKLGADARHRVYTECTHKRAA